MPLGICHCLISKHLMSVPLHASQRSLLSHNQPHELWFVSRVMKDLIVEL